MKNIKINIIIFSILICRSSFGQISEDSQEINWKSLIVYASIAPGYEILNADSANLTIASSVGANFRKYSKKGNRFTDYDISIMPLIKDGHHFTNFLKGSYGYGFIRNAYNTQVHLNFAYNFYNYSHLIGFGYYVEAQSVPITVDIMATLAKKSEKVKYYAVIGIKLPIYGRVF